VAEIEDCKVLGDFLSQAQARNKKSGEQINEELGVSSTHAWHQYRSFPDESRLPDIARVYEVDLEELRAAYEKAKAGRQVEKESRRATFGRRLKPNVAANYDLPSFGPVSGRCHSSRNGRGR
jgi:hypothetical protein